MAAEAVQVSRCNAGAADAGRSVPVRCPDAAVHTVQPGERWTLWVKQRGREYGKLRGVNPDEDVDDFKARWAAHAKLDEHVTLFRLKLVKRGPGVPGVSEEEQAEPLDPQLTLREAGVADGSALLLTEVASDSSAGATVVQVHPAGALRRLRLRGRGSCG